MMNASLKKKVASIERALRKGAWNGTREASALESALYTVRQGYSTFYEPLDRVARDVVAACTRSHALIGALAESAPRWPNEMRDAFLLVAGYGCTWTLKYEAPFSHCKWDAKAQASYERFRERLLELFASLPPASNPTVRRRLGQWGLTSKRAPKLPAALPDTMDAALALYASCGLGPKSLSLGKRGKKPPASLPAPLRAFYAAQSQLGSRDIFPAGRLAALTRDFCRCAKQHAAEDEGEVSRGEIHLGRLSAPKALVPFGKDASGDFFFVDPAFGRKRPPVLRFHHDEAMTCTVAASSVPAYVAGVILRAAFGAGVHRDRVDALIARDRKRVKVTSAMAKHR